MTGDGVVDTLIVKGTIVKGTVPFDTLALRICEQARRTKSLRDGFKLLLF